MSNRGRQNVASYLVLDLGVDWRRGGDYFESLLLDYDVTSNWGNWVAAAGLTGGRINHFNITKQVGARACVRGVYKGCVGQHSGGGRGAHTNNRQSKTTKSTEAGTLAECLGPLHRVRHACRSPGQQRTA